jgi:imidazole glycerol-phosphate synthase subunit HisH
VVAIIDYGMGNVASVRKALDFLRISSRITFDEKEIRESDHIILPGVGSFTQGMKNLASRNLVEILSEEVLIKKKPFLGVCLGMQLLIDYGSEPDTCKGLGWIAGEVIKLTPDNLAVPHLGWNDISVINDQFFRDIPDRDYYFIHSYHMKPSDRSVIAATVEYGEILVAAIQKDNIFATQFHPEKSQQAGLGLLRNFFSANA